MCDSFDAISYGVQFSSFKGIYVVLDRSSKQSVEKQIYLKRTWLFIPSNWKYARVQLQPE